MNKKMVLKRKFRKIDTKSLYYNLNLLVLALGKLIVWTFIFGFITLCILEYAW